MNSLSKLTRISILQGNEYCDFVKVSDVEKLMAEKNKATLLIKSLNETIEVELTDCGATHLNKYHKELSEKFKTVTWKFDYKECDIYKDQAYSIFSVFEPFFHAGASMPFINLRTI